MRLFLLIILAIVAAPFVIPFWLVIWTFNLIYLSGHLIKKAGELGGDYTLEALRAFTGGTFMKLYRKIMGEK